MISLSKFIIMSMIVLLAGCTRTIHPSPILRSSSSSNPLNAVDVYKAADKRQTDIALTEAAVSVSNSLGKLAEIQQAMHPQARLPEPPNAARIGLSDLASVDWTGPVEPLARKVANIAHYRLRVLGRAPAIPIIVSITAKDTPLADILRDIGFQAEQQASLTLYPSSHVIELRYRGA